MRIRLLIVVVATLTSVAVACSSGGSDPPSCASFDTSTSVAMADFSFTPECIGADAGATLDLDNGGDAPHTFTVEGTPVSVDVPAGEHATADLADVTPGTYTVVCTYHPQMKAVLRVA
jgi:plastocyanin